jgi:hypothetical protein
MYVYIHMYIMKPTKYSLTNGAEEEGQWKYNGVGE